MKGYLKIILLFGLPALVTFFLALSYLDALETDAILFSLFLIGVILYLFALHYSNLAVLKKIQIIPLVLTGPCLALMLSGIIAMDISDMDAGSFDQDTAVGRAGLLLAKSTLPALSLVSFFLIFSNSIMLSLLYTHYDPKSPGKVFRNKPIMAYLVYDLVYIGLIILMNYVVRFKR